MLKKLACLAAVAGFALPVAAQVVDLGTLDTYPAGANAINSTGEVAGFYTGGGTPQAFRYTQIGGLQALGDLGGTVTATAYGINASGVIVGEAGAPGGTEAFRWESGTITSLGTLGGANSTAYAVNNSGVSVGVSDTTISPDREAFQWTSGGGMVSLGTLGGNFSEARGISASGTIVGTSLNSLGDQRAFLYNSMMTDLLGANAAGVSNAFGISGNRVVGSFADGADTKPFLFDFGTNTFTDLTTVAGGTFFDGGFGQALAVNAAGIVVGTAQTSLGRRAWVYNGDGLGSVKDLSTAVNASGSGFDVLTDANAISDNGFIAGIGVVGADERAFATFQPVPAPPAAVSLLIGSGIGALMTGGKRFVARKKR